MRQSKAEKAAEKLYDDAFRMYGNHVLFSVMDFGKMSKLFHASIADGKTSEDAMLAVVAKYRQD